MLKRRSLRGRSGRTCRAGGEGVVRGGGRSRRYGRGEGRSLDGRFVVSPQDAHAG